VLVTIERDSPVAPWQQLAAILRNRIEAGELAPGARLPSIVDLRQEFDLAYSTVQKALAQLKDEGLVTTSPMGTFVRRES
jgi:GntR family transcriptional regulator